MTVVVLILFTIIIKMVLRLFASTLNGIPGNYQHASSTPVVPHLGRTDHSRHEPVKNEGSDAVSELKYSIDMVILSQIFRMHSLTIVYITMLR